MGAASIAALCLWVTLAHTRAAAFEDDDHREAQWAARRARGEMAPGRMHYAGKIRVQGQTQPIAVTITIQSRRRTWAVYEEWTIGGDPSHMEVSELEKGTLYLVRHTSQAGERVLRELEVQDGWVAGWNATPDSPDPQEQIFIDAPDPIFAWGAGIPQVIATLPLADGYRTTYWNIALPHRVVSRTLEVVGRGRLEIPAGRFIAWKVVVRASEPGGSDMTLWIDTRSRQVLRFGARTRGPGPDWAVTLDGQP
jgi:hypothetical protein